MGLHGDKGLLNWFTTEYAKAVPVKLDMGKTCIRFKKPEHIPLALIEELAGKTTVNDRVLRYEAARKG